MATFDFYAAGLPKSPLASGNLLPIIASTNKNSTTYSSAASTLHRFNASTNDGYVQNLARRCKGRRISRLHDGSCRRHGRARCRARYPAHAGAGPRLPMELQGWEMRVVLGGSQWNAETHVYDATERVAVGKTSDSRANESLSDPQGFGHGGLVEFSGEEKDKTVQ